MGTKYVAAALIGIFAAGAYLYTAQQGQPPADSQEDGSVSGPPVTPAPASNAFEGSIRLHNDSDSLSDAKTKEALKRLVDVHFDQLPLREALDYLENRYAIQFYIDGSKNSGMAAKGKLPVTLVLTQVPVSTVLDLMFREYELVYRIWHGVVIVTPEDSDLADQHVQRIYYSRNLQMSVVMDAITSTVSPAGWDEMGGSNSLLTVGPRILIVSAPTDVHDGIEDLMQALELANEKSKAPVPQGERQP